MADLARKRDVAVSMRFRDDDLGIIDRGAELSGLSRTEFMRRAALHEAQIAILNETVVRFSPEAFDHFLAAIDAPAAAIPDKMRERLSRKAPWDEIRRMISPPEPLDADCDLTAFDCGKPALNDWLRTYALANQAKGFTRVMVVREGARVIGFYGLAPTAVPPAILSRKVRTGRPPDPAPCILFGQLAVDKAYAGKGVGSALLRHALERCVAGAKAIGGRAVIVRAIDRDAEEFWKSCGFTASSADGSTLFRSVEDVEAWLGKMG